MTRFTRRPNNVSYEDMWSYIKSENTDEITIFEYLYLLCKEYLRNKGYRLSADQLETVSLKLSSLVFKVPDYRIYNKIDEILDKYSPSIYLDCKYESKVNITSDNYSVRNRLLEILDGYCLLGRADLSSFVTKIEAIIDRLPKKKLDNEFDYLQISILKSFCKTLDTLDDSIFDLGSSIPVSVVLYRLPETYYEYIRCITLQLVGSLRDNMVITQTVNGENIYSIHLKEVLKNER